MWYLDSVHLIQLSVPPLLGFLVGEIQQAPFTEPPAEHMLVAKHIPASVAFTQIKYQWTGLASKGSIKSTGFFD